MTQNEIKECIKDSAFPQKHEAEGGNIVATTGLTKREIFAAMAMQAILSKPVDNIKQAAKESVIAADALIEELNETR